MIRKRFGVDQRFHSELAIVFGLVGRRKAVDNAAAKRGERVTAVIEIAPGIPGIVEMDAVERVPRQELAHGPGCYSMAPGVAGERYTASAPAGCERA